MMGLPTRQTIRIFRHTKEECWTAYNEKMESGDYESLTEPMFVGYNGGKFDKCHYYAEVKRV